jgi:integral membrane protein (TIGR01906 family)
LKILGITARWVFVLCLPVMLFTASLAWGFNSLWLYKYGFHKFGVSQSTGIPESELDRSAHELIHYFNNNAEFIQVTIIANGKTFPLFTEQEQDHFKDVKGLIRLDYNVLGGTLAFVLMFGLWAAFGLQGQRRRMLARTLIWGSGLTLLLLLILAVAAVVDFNQLFIDLHYLIFSNTDWSAPGYMLMLFPGDFWFDAALICFGFMAGLAVILGGMAIGYLVLRKNPSGSTSPSP